jgi:hypothetical protein
MASTPESVMSNVLSFRNTLHAIRASLFARAVAALFRCSRAAACSSHAPKLNFFQLCGRIRIMFAA